ncbi:MAG: hypothetical protein O2809_06400, partial [Proteobacteria bacterium]|nr:hypothetical protein [Pseudomonadota bacterium]
MAIGNELLELDKDLAVAIYDTAESGLFQKIDELQRSFLYFQEKFPELKLQQNNVISFERDAELGDMLVQLKRFLEYLVNYCVIDVDNSNLKLSDLEEKITGLQYIEGARLKWLNLSLTKNLVPAVLPLSLQVGENLQTQISRAQETLHICNIAKDNMTLKNVLVSQPDFERYQEIKGSLESFKAYLSEANTTQKAFYDLGQVNKKQWLYSSAGAIHALIDKNKRAIENDNWLNTWLSYACDRNELANKGLDKLIAQVESQLIRIDDLSDLAKAVIYHQLSKELLQEYSWLNEFSGNRQDAIRQKFKEYDDKLLELQRQKIAYQASQCKIPRGVNSGKVGNFSELSLIKHEASKKARHIA